MVLFNKVTVWTDVLQRLVKRKTAWVILAGLAVVIGLGCWAHASGHELAIVGSSHVAKAPPIQRATQQALTASVKTQLTSQGAGSNVQSEVIARKVQGQFARVDVETPQGGYMMLLKQIGNTWKTVYTGQDLDSATEQSLGFPANFAETPPYQSTALYTTN